MTYSSIKMQLKVLTEMPPSIHFSRETALPPGIPQCTALALRTAHQVSSWRLLEAKSPVLISVYLQLPSFSTAGPKKSENALQIYFLKHADQGKGVSV